MNHTKCLDQVVRGVSKAHVPRTPIDNSMRQMQRFEMRVTVVGLRLRIQARQG